MHAFLSALLVYTFSFLPISWYLPALEGPPSVLVFRCYVVGALLLSLLTPESECRSCQQTPEPHDSCVQHPMASATGWLLVMCSGSTSLSRTVHCVLQLGLGCQSVNAA